MFRSWSREGGICIGFLTSDTQLALPHLRQSFEIQTDASDYAMGVVLLQHGKPISFHSKMFNGAVINYPTYDKELYVLVQSVKKWKNYLMALQWKDPLTKVIKEVFSVIKLAKIVEKTFSTTSIYGYEGFGRAFNQSSTKIENLGGWRLLQMFFSSVRY